MIIHLPHASTVIPDSLRGQFLLSDQELAAELLLLTDRFTDELFAFPKATILQVPHSRLVVDVERFPDDDAEPMAKLGMGRFYTRTSQGKPLRRELSPAETDELKALYDSHHLALTKAVAEKLDEYRAVLIIDGHSFPDVHLPWNKIPDQPLPDFCIGRDPHHTPAGMAECIKKFLEGLGYSVGIDYPYAGSIVPLEFLGKNRRVASIMIEVNRRLYMDEKTGTKTTNFATVQQDVRKLLQNLSEMEIDARRPKPSIFKSVLSIDPSIIIAILELHDEGCSIPEIKARIVQGERMLAYTPMHLEQLKQMAAQIRDNDIAIVIQYMRENPK